MSESECTHPKCVLPHPHPGPAILAVHDWRGTRVEAGDLVIYGAPVGRSIAMVEARVSATQPFTKSGRVNLDVIRRAYGGWSYGTAAKPVHVGPDRLTVIDSLPESEHATEDEKRQARKARLASVQ